MVGRFQYHGEQNNALYYRGGLLKENKLIQKIE